MACRWQNMTFSSSSHLRIFTWSLRYLSVEWAGKGHKVHKCRMVSTGVLEADKDAKGWLDKLYSVKLVNLLGGYGSSGCWRWAPPQTDRHCCTSVAVPDGWYFLYCAAEKMVQRGLVAVLTSSRHKYRRQDTKSDPRGQKARGSRADNYKTKSRQKGNTRIKISFHSRERVGVSSQNTDKYRQQNEGDTRDIASVSKNLTCVSWWMLWWADNEIKCLSCV